MERIKTGNYRHEWIDYRTGPEQATVSGPATTYYRRADILRHFGWREIPPLDRVLSDGLTVADHIQDVEPYRVIR